MFTTYFIENTNTSEVKFYYENLTAAKRDLIEAVTNKKDPWFNEPLRIVQVKGAYKYEGVHQYQLEYVNNKFIKTKLIRSNIMTDNKYNGWTNWHTWEANNMLMNVNEEIYHEALRDTNNHEGIINLIKVGLIKCNAASDHIDFDQVNFDELIESLNSL